MRELHVLWVATGYALVSLMGGLAMWRGGWAERSATLIIWVAWAINPLLQTGFDPGVATFCADAVVTILLISISYFSRRYWTLLAAGSALAAVFCHLARPFAHAAGLFSFISVLGLVGGIYLALALGMAALEAELLRNLSDKSPPRRYQRHDGAGEP